MPAETRKEKKKKYIYKKKKKKKKEGKVNSVKCQSEIFLDVHFHCRDVESKGPPPVPLNVLPFTPEAVSQYSFYWLASTEFHTAAEDITSLLFSL